jgi:ElaB/YqjD/DUF883 family membrane-anchored ribosome-binding protein
MTVNINFPHELKIVVEHVGQPEVKEIIMKLDEVIAQVSAISSQLSRARAEILDRIQKLQDAMGDLTPEQVAAIDQLKAAAASIDDIAPPIEEPAPEPEPQDTKKPENAFAGKPVDPKDKTAEERKADSDQEENRMKGSPVGLGAKSTMQSDPKSAKK